MNIIEFLKDPNLGGRLKPFCDLTTWAAWIVLLKAAFALSLTDDESDLFIRYTGRNHPPTSTVGLIAAIIGRRGGKGIIAALLAVYLGSIRDWRKHLAPGEVGHVAVIAQSLKASRTVFGYIRGIFRAIPSLEQLIVRETADEIELSTGIIISCWPCTYRSTRGLTIVVAICDEIDFWFQEGPHMAEEVVASVRPAMLTVPGAILILISSPYTPTGYLHKVFQEHWGKNEDDVLVWKAPSLIMNPTLSAAKIAKAIAQDPDRGRAEYEAEWRMGVATAFESVLVDQAARSNPLILPPRQGIRYAGGVDVSGGGDDEFAWYIAHREGDRIIGDLLSARGRRWLHGLRLEDAVRICAEDMKAYGIHEVIGDYYAAQWPPEAFARHGLKYRRAGKPKSELYRELLPVFLAGTIEIPADSDLVRQLKLLQRRTGTQGKDVIEHPRGTHDDRANALAVAVMQLTEDRLRKCCWCGGDCGLFCEYTPSREASDDAAETANAASTNMIEAAIRAQGVWWPGEGASSRGDMGEDFWRRFGGR